MLRQFILLALIHVVSAHLRSIGGQLPRMLNKHIATPRRARDARAAVDLSSLLFNAQLAAETAVSEQLTSLSPVSVLVLYGAGLLTSLTPCCLSMLPLTMSYIGSGSFADSQSDRSQTSSSFAAVAFSVGLACSFAALGVAASSAGAVLGSGRCWCSNA